MEKLNKIFKNSAKYFFFVLLAYLVVTCFLRGISRDLDFQVFHKVATRIAQGDLNIYDFTQDGIFSYKYTPTAALLFLPLLSFGHPLASSVSRKEKELSYFRLHPPHAVSLLRQQCHAREYQQHDLFPHCGKFIL